MRILIHNHFPLICRTEMLYVHNINWHMLWGRFPILFRALNSENDSKQPQRSQFDLAATWLNNILAWLRGLSVPFRFDAIS